MLPGEKRIKANAATRRWQAANPDRVRENWRRQAWKKRFYRYGVTPDWYRDQLIGQAGRCAICYQVFVSDKDTHIDHDHATGRVRGLLCGRCNQFIGLANESVDRLQAAVVYLSKEFQLCPR